jgi:protein gp37
MLMAENSKIEWCDHTFNPWIGCQAVSPACDHCYAEKLVNGRMAGNFAERRRTSTSNWALPLRWNRQAEREGRRYRVFCASLADVFDNKVPPEWRADLFYLIQQTPNLDWLLLTKRPQNAWTMMQAAAPTAFWPLPNVWLGTTVENQTEADRRIPHLLATPAAVHFLSCEPLLGPVDLMKRAWRDCHIEEYGGAGHELVPMIRGIDWVIAGGESGPGARPMHPALARSLRDQCAAAGVPFHFKQWGEWLSFDSDDDSNWYASHPASLPLRWWDGAAWREATGEPPATGDWVARVGKKTAGRLLDGIEHNGMPATP